jgi:hypothetical protein
VLSPRLHRPLALALLALALAGCGSSSSHRATPNFVGQLDSLCTQGNAAVRGARSLTAAIVVFQNYLAKVRVLTPPAQSQQAFTEFLAFLNQRLADLKQHDLTAAQKLHAPIARLATQMGAGECAK